MKNYTIGLIREEKVPQDKRVALSPTQCRSLLDKYPTLKIIVQPSDFRCFSDAEYEALDIPLSNNLDDCDVLFGVKEVPINQMLAGKHYFFFSHTIKKQSYNRKLLKAVLEKNITLTDYEVLTDKLEERLVAFGRYAGIVGAYNGLITFGKRNELYELKPAHQCFDFNEIREQLQKVKLPAIKIVVTGAGRVGKGVAEILDLVRIRRVSPYEILNQTFDEAVYTVLHSSDYHQPKDKSGWNSQQFYENPELFDGSFFKYAKVADILMAGAYWHPTAPKLFSKSEMKSPDFKIKVIADITCDIEGSVPSTLKASTITDPFYDYNPDTEQLEAPFSQKSNITVMAIDNLPCELPRDSSKSFSEQLANHIIPRLLESDTDHVIKRATIAQDGKLMEDYMYLREYAGVKV